MQAAQRLASLPEYAFPRLRRLIAGHQPGGRQIAMSIGEPKHAVPEFIGEVLARHVADYNRYPPNDGTLSLRTACADWASQRYALPEGRLDPETNILNLNGTREGLYNACVALCPETKNGQRPAVLIPNPFYQCYAVAALAAGADPVYVNATEETGNLPDFEALPKDLLDRTAIVYLCSPANPQGAAADMERWQALIRLAETHDFRIFADECYSEIYRGQAPVGALEAAAQMGADPERVLAFHSLSKRSNLAGLRSGFVAGGAEAIARLKTLRNYTGAPCPLPAQHAAEAAWRDEAHVVANRALYCEKYQIADRILGNFPGYRGPEAGFFLWLPVEDDERATMDLWTKAGVLTLPGSYLSRDADPALGGGNPGARRIRAALVAPADEIAEGLEAIRDILS